MLVHMGALVCVGYVGYMVENAITWEISEKLHGSYANCIQNPFLLVNTDKN